MKRLAVLCVLAVVLAASPAQSQIPLTMSYQGVLTLDSGPAAPDGPYNFLFTIYDGPNPGANVLWTENHNNVPVRLGGFSVILGMGTPAHPLNLDFDKQYYLGIAVDVAPNPPVTELTPRTVLAGSPYSLGGWVNSGNDIYKPSGRVGIGRTPNMALDVAGIVGIGKRLELPARVTESTEDTRINLFSGPTRDDEFWSLQSNSFVDHQFAALRYENGVGQPQKSFFVSGAGNVGIGTSNAGAKLHVVGANAAVIQPGAQSGIILSSPNGNCFRIIVDNFGAVSATSVACP